MSRTRIDADHVALIVDESGGYVVSWASLPYIDARGKRHTSWTDAVWWLRAGLHDWHGYTHYRARDGRIIRIRPWPGRY